jgi:hypothetical protein
MSSKVDAHGVQGAGVSMTACALIVQEHGS